MLPLLHVLPTHAVRVLQRRAQHLVTAVPETLVPQTYKVVSYQMRFIAAASSRHHEIEAIMQNHPRQLDEFCILVKHFPDSALGVVLIIVDGNAEALPLPLGV